MQNGHEPNVLCMPSLFSGNRDENPNGGIEVAQTQTLYLFNIL